MCANHLIEIEALSFSHHQRVIFDQVSLQVPVGKVTAIMGPSGIGKTTLLRLIAGQLQPQTGKIRFDGQEITSLKRRELFELRKRMSMLFQSGALFTDMTVFDNVAFPLREHDIARNFDPNDCVAQVGSGWTARCFGFDAKCFIRRDGKTCRACESDSP